MNEERKIEAMPAGALQLAEHRRNIWVVEAADGVQPEDLLAPSYWAHHSGKLSPWDKVEVRAKDGSWYQELLVMDASRVWARVIPLSKPVHLTTADVSQTQAVDFEVMHRGPRKWSVIRKKDRAVMFEDGALKDDAEQFLRENSDALASGRLSPVT